ncbi:hypothetical protein [Algibacillus agarilyticus]|uniref:hypothetical protein n=1 Tax=Algibacillus agarilyticus TaxID=2234133 RepID=UPI000DCF68A0|nr:hypothetical protein [Algibacillus agarilyticus]
MLTTNHKIAQTVGLSLLMSSVFAQNENESSSSLLYTSIPSHESVSSFSTLKVVSYQSNADLSRDTDHPTLLKPLNISRWQRNKSINVQSALTEATQTSQARIDIDGVKVHYTWNNTASVNASFYQLSVQDKNTGDETLYEESRFAVGADYGQFSQAGFHAGLAVSHLAVTELDMHYNTIDGKALALQLSYGIDDKLTVYSKYQVADDETIDINETTEGQAVSLGAWYSWTPNIGGYVEAKVDENNSTQAANEQLKEGLMLGLRINL